MVTVPYPAPPSQLTGFSLTDVASDQGGYETVLESFSDEFSVRGT